MTRLLAACSLVVSLTACASSVQPIATTPAFLVPEEVVAPTPAPKPPAAASKKWKALAESARDNIGRAHRDLERAKPKSVWTARPAHLLGH